MRTQRALTRQTTAAAAVLALAGAALAQTDSQFIYTNEADPGIDAFMGGAVQRLADVTNPGAFLGGIVRVGPDLFFTDGAGDADPSATSGLFRLSDPFGAATISPVATGMPIENPIGLQWDAGRDNFIVIDNAFTPTPDSVDGVLGITPGGSVSTIFREDLSVPRPRYQAAARLAPDPTSNGFLVPSINGSGAVTGPGEDAGSALFRLNIDGSLEGSTELIVDLADTSVTGLDAPLVDTAGVAVNPSTGLVYLTDRRAGAIYELALTADGAFDSIRAIIDGLDNPEEIQYDPFNDRLVFDENIGEELGRISQVELDGSERKILVDEVDTRGLVVIPAPAGAAVLGLGGLALARRRRS